LDLAAISELGPTLAKSELELGLTRPHIPRLRLGNEVKSAAASANISATIDESDTVRIGDSEESTIRETEDEGEAEEGEIQAEGEVYVDGEYEREEGEEVELADVTVSLVDVLGMVKYKGERTTALMERIQKLSHKLQQLQHHRHIEQLQQLHEQQMMQKGESTIGIKQSTGGMGWWSLVFVVLVGGLGIILFILRKNVYFSSLHPS
jgi:hypothetical protein